MKPLNKVEILASSSGWVASLLNFIPGLGAGYLYQRRWRPYFLTLISIFSWFALGIILKGNNESTLSDQLIGISGLLLISIVTVIESYLSYKKSIKLITSKAIENIEPKQVKGWFRNS